MLPSRIWLYISDLDKVRLEDVTFTVNDNEKTMEAQNNGDVNKEEYEKSVFFYLLFFLAFRCTLKTITECIFICNRGDLHETEVTK